MPNIPKYQKVADRLAKMVADGVLRPGEAVPSIRKLSQQWNISISTVLAAYSRLEARGMLHPRPRSGYYVSTRLPSAQAEPAVSQPEPDPKTVSMRELITMIILKDTANKNLVQLGAAHPDSALCATSRLNRHMAAAGRRIGERSGDYLPPGGSSRLRRQIALHAINAGCSLEADDVLITAGCGEAVYLCLKATCQPGDTVAVESPICFDVFQYLENLGLKALEIPTHPREGISIEALSFALEHNSVQACVVISNYSNPLGSCLPDQRKEKLVELLAEHHIPLIENDIFADIHHRLHRPLSAKAFDTRGMVLWCGSFSKTLSPGLRVGWTAPGKFLAQVEWLKFSASLATATMPQLAIASFMEEGGYRQHLRKIRRIYAERLGTLRQAVCRFFPQDIKVTAPAGGYLLWIELPKQVNALDLYTAALREGIAITPGHLFSAAGHYQNFIRLSSANWTQMAEPEIKRLGRVVASMR